MIGRLPNRSSYDRCDGDVYVHPYDSAVALPVFAFDQHDAGDESGRVELTDALRSMYKRSPSIAEDLAEHLGPGELAAPSVVAHGTVVGLTRASLHIEPRRIRSCHASSGRRRDHCDQSIRSAPRRTRSTGVSDGSST